jgi:metallo-beta-lactamase family protein
MKVTFCGAAKIVTGSCYLVEAAGRRILVDCGMFQGGKETTRLNFQPFRFGPKTVSHVLLTHAHNDHGGLLPRLVKEHFRGKIIATRATADLLGIMLEDSARIQEVDTEHENRRRRREGLAPRKPLYTVEDAERAHALVESVDYDRRFVVAPGIEACFRDAGHILGSAILELFVTEGGKAKKLVFSGDLGQWNVPIIRNPTIIEEADAVFVESTYGDRLHEGAGDRESELARHAKETYARGGRVLIPSFAIERTQEIIYALGNIIERGEFPDMRIYLDSPLAIKVTEVFKKHRECFDEEALERFGRLKDAARVIYCEQAEDSMKLNDISEPCVIIAGSGMCTGGRIRHHLKHGLWDARNTILFVGYQAQGSLGRIILDGAKEVKMMGMAIVVKAGVGQIGSFSAHADAGELLKWMKGFRRRPERVFVIHGEASASAALQGRLEKEGLSCHVPDIGETVDL